MRPMLQPGLISLRLSDESECSLILCEFLLVDHVVVVNMLVKVVVNLAGTDKFFIVPVKDDAQVVVGYCHEAVVLQQYSLGSHIFNRGDTRL